MPPVWLVLLLAAALGCPRPGLAHGDLHGRIATFDARIAATPANAALWLARADLRRQHGDLPGALADALQAEALQPGWPAAHLQLARVHFGRGEFTNAIRSASACLARETNNADALVIRARSRRALGEFAAARDDLSAALRGAARPLPDLFVERAQCDAALGNFSAAARGLDEGIARLGPTPSLLLPALEYEGQGSDVTNALRRLDAARRYLPVATYQNTRSNFLARPNPPAPNPLP